MSALRLVLFDCDGTLVDSAGHIVRAMQHAFTAHDLPPPSDAAVKSIIGLSLDRAVAELAGADQSVRDDLVRAYKTHYRDIGPDRAAAEPLFEGIEAVLDALGSHSETLMGVATGKSRVGLDRILTSHGLSRHFVTTVTADDAASKPAPDMVHVAVRATGIPARRTVVIGDSGFDMVMAREAGAHAIGVTWGYQDRARLVAAGAETIAEAVGELPALVDGLVAP